jgi:inosose dehydratase
MTGDWQPRGVAAHLMVWKALDAGLEGASGLGYGAVEAWPDDAWPYVDRPQDFRDLLARRGLSLSALYSGGEFTNPAREQRILTVNPERADFIAACGADRIIMGAGSRPHPGPLTVPELRRAARVLDETARRCADAGALACLHQHMGTEVETRAELDAMMELTSDAVRLCPDTGHLALAGMDPAEVIRTYASRVDYVHLKDVTSPGAPAGTPVFCELGAGRLDVPGIVAALRDIDYRGWITVELDDAVGSPTAAMRRSRDHLQRACGVAVVQPGRGLQ